MKKAFMIIGVISTTVIILLGGLIAVVATNGRRMDRESKQYADSAIRVIAGTWDETQLMNRASPELVEFIRSHGGTQPLFEHWERLGHLRNIEDLRGEANASLIFGSDMKITAAYVGRAEFEHGTANLKITLIKHGAGWSILGLWVYPDLPDGAGAVHQMRSLVSVPPGSLFL